ncbi:LysE family translocator [Aureimonas mangrovi]|uniref:LysE family translocator n=1 Tax=Aureimonas mangrovi TaxID=2758041 RepID=UPI00163DCCA8|nr:LysE family translocator [Aureimonas mangrovi]
MTFETAASFAAIAALLVMSPGPNGVLVARTVPGSGKVAGFANIAGFVTAFYVHCTLAVFGLSIILVQSANAFLAVKLAGALYLCWIGVKALREAMTSRRLAALDKAAPARPRNLRVAYVEGLLTNVFNPKVALFYLAAFPQFIGAETSPIAAGYALATLHASINIAWFTLVIVLVDRASTFARGERFTRLLKAVTGIAFLGFGWRLATYRP